MKKYSVLKLFKVCYIRYHGKNKLYRNPSQEFHFIIYKIKYNVYLNKNNIFHSRENIKSCISQP